MDIEVNGARLSYTDKGHGQPVVFVTGFGGYQEIWTEQVSYLLEMGYRVITYDHRNHGHSERTADSPLFIDLVDDLAKLIHQLSLDKPLLVAHSMGASVCYALLQKHPEVSVRGLLAVDQSPKMINDEEWHYGFRDIHLDDYQKKLTHPQKVHETYRGLVPSVSLQLNRAKIASPFDRKRNIPLLLDHVLLDWRPILFATEVPVMMICSTDSPYYDFHFSQVCSKNNDNISAVVLSACGHDPMAEIPRRFNQLLRHFVLKNG